MIYEIAHQMGLLPMLAVLATWRRTSLQYRAIAFAFAVSWVADSAMHFLGGSWDIAYVWLPIQFALVLMALRPDVLLLGAVMLVALASRLMSAPEPDWLLTVTGSWLVLLYARGAIALPLAAYFGAGSLAYVAMLATMGSERFMLAWYAYQSCRLVAVCSFVAIVLRGGRSWTPMSFWRKCSPA